MPNVADAGKSFVMSVVPRDMRLKTDIWVSALIRRVSADGGFATVLHKGNAAAGAVFIAARGPDGLNNLYGPAPQALMTIESASERVFEPLGLEISDSELQARLTTEMRFDPDLWLVEIEDRERRPFVDLVKQN